MKEIIIGFKPAYAADVESVKHMIFTIDESFCQSVSYVGDISFLNLKHGSVVTFIDVDSEVKWQGVYAGWVRVINKSLIWEIVWTEQKAQVSSTRLPLGAVKAKNGLYPYQNDILERITSEEITKLAQRMSKSLLGNRAGKAMKPPKITSSELADAVRRVGKAMNKALVVFPSVETVEPITDDELHIIMTQLSGFQYRQITDKIVCRLVKRILVDAAKDD